RTNLIISHRISAVSGADEIIVMTDGKITERGTDSELRENNGIYAAMAKRQEVEANLALSNQASQNLKTELVPS
ncbi:metal ABC transporter permease, partial [Myxococcota bacterium]|nr:metal ABC transporter permease [Myxococcota bacterium]